MTEEFKIIAFLLENGIATVFSLLLVYVLWKLGHKVLDSNKEISIAHKSDMKELADLHRQERKECYANQDKQIQKFDETIRMVITNAGGSK